MPTTEEGIFGVFIVRGRAVLPAGEFNSVGPMSFRKVRWCAIHDSQYRFNNGTIHDPHYECWSYSEDGFVTSECEFVDKLLEAS